MNDPRAVSESANSLAYRYSRLAAAGLLIVHATALLVFYFVPVFVLPIFQFHYQDVGAFETPLFFRAHLISGFLISYTQPLMLVAVLYLFLLYRRARAGSRWLGAASNMFLLSIAIFGMVFTAWMANPMVYFPPSAAVVTDIPPEIETVALSTPRFFDSH